MKKVNTGRYMQDHVQNPLPGLNLSIIGIDQPEAFHDLVRWFFKNGYYDEKKEALISRYRIVNGDYDVDLIEKYFRENEIKFWVKPSGLFYSYYFEGLNSGWGSGFKSEDAAKAAALQEAFKKRQKAFI